MAENMPNSILLPLDEKSMSTPENRSVTDVVAHYLETLQSFESLVNQDASRRQNISFDPSNSCQYSLLRCLEEIGKEITGKLTSVPHSDLRGEALIDFFSLHSNMQWRYVTLSPGFEQHESGTLLAFTKGNLYPCVLRWESRILKSGYIAYSPKIDGPFALSGASVEFERYAYTFYSRFDNSDLNARALLLFSWHFIKSRLFLLLGISLIISAAALFPSFILSQIVTDVIPGSATGLLFQYGSLLFVLLLTSNVLNFVRNEILLNLQAVLSLRLGSALWDRILDQTIPDVNRFSSSELFRRSQGLFSIQALASGQWAVVMIDGLLSLSNIALMIFFSPSLTLYAVLIIAVLVASSILAIRASLLMYIDRSKFLSLNIGLTQGLLALIEVLRVNGSEAFALRKWSSYFSKQQSYDLRISKTSDRNSLLAKSVVACLNVFILCVAIVTINHYGQSQGISVGQLIGFNSAFGVLLASLVQLASVIVSQQQQIKFHWSELKPVITPSHRKATLAERLILPNTLSVRELSFRYPSAKRNTLNSVSLEVNHGEHVALVGRSGSGKSTLVRLILGFEDVQSGFVGFNGISILRTNLKSLRRSMGVVLQDVDLISGTIGENVSAGLSLSDDEIWSALEQAAMAEFVHRLPLKLNTPVVSGGLNFSGGERQRIMIARALSRKPSFLIMDEATSALDNQSQSKVEESIAALRCTRLTIAHRLSTIKTADRIVMLSDGRVVEDGTFYELVDRKTHFFRLISTQLSS